MQKKSFCKKFKQMKQIVDLLIGSILLLFCNSFLPLYHMQIRNEPMSPQSQKHEMKINYFSLK